MVRRVGPNKGLLAFVTVLLAASSLGVAQVQDDEGNLIYRQKLMSSLGASMGEYLTAGHSFEQALEKTVRWYVDNQWWWRRIKTGEYMRFYRQWYGERLAAPADPQ